MVDNRIGKKAELVLGQKIQARRVLKGMTPLQLGQAINKPRQQIAKYEAGEFVPLTVLEEIANVLEARITKQMVRRISFLRKLEIETKKEQDELVPLYQALFEEE